MAKDPGQTFQTAKAFQISEVSQTVTDKLSAKDQIDIWKIKPKVRSSFDLTLGGIAPKANADVELLNANKRVIAFSNQRGSKTEQLSNVFLEPGTFYIRIKLQPHSPATPYALTLSDTPVVDLFGDSFTTAAPLKAAQATLSNFVDNAAPKDFFFFSTLVAGKFKVNLTGLSDDANLALYSGDRKLLAASNKAGTLNERLNQALTGIAGSTYYLKVSQAPGKSTSYNLSYSYAPDPIKTTPSGLEYIDLERGKGATPKTGQTVTVQYTGILLNGKKFDSSRDRNQPFSFSIGTGKVIKGWDEGISTMRVGGRRQLIILAGLAYGANGVPGAIPPNAPLIFDVEVLGIS